MKTIQLTLSNSASILEQKLPLDRATAYLEVQLLLAHALQQSRVWLLTHSDEGLTDAEQQFFLCLLERRLQGEPIAYILGRREFYGLNLCVTAHTLIPRPDSELLVEVALDKIPHHQHSLVLDLGTGSGALALAIAHQRAHLQMIASDISPDALAVARDNACSLGLTHLHWLASDWFAGLGKVRFDVIVSNPPYLCTTDAHLPALKFEPQLALLAGDDGLQALRHIIAHAHQYLIAQGWLVLEHAYNQALAVGELLKSAGFQNTHSFPDLNGHLRVSVGQCLSHCLKS